MKDCRLTVRSLVLASRIALMLLDLGVVLPAANMRLSLRENGLMICVMLDMALFSLRGVLLKEKARLTRLPNLRKGGGVKGDGGIWGYSHLVAARLTVLLPMSLVSTLSTPGATEVSRVS